MTPPYVTIRLTPDEAAAALDVLTAQMRDTRLDAPAFTTLAMAAAAIRGAAARHADGREP